MSLSKTQDVFSAKSIYSPEGRLRAIGSAFLEESKHQETQLHLEKVEAAKQSVHSTEEKATVTDVVEPFDPILPSGWRMQDLAESVSWPSKALREIMLNRMHEICYTKEEISRFNMCNNMPKHAKTYHNKTHACLFFSPSWLLFVVSHVFFIASFFDVCVVANNVSPTGLPFLPWHLQSGSFGRRSTNGSGEGYPNRTPQQKWTPCSLAYAEIREIWCEKRVRELERIQMFLEVLSPRCQCLHAPGIHWKTMMWQTLRCHTAQRNLRSWCLPWRKYAWVTWVCLNIEIGDMRNKKTYGIWFQDVKSYHKLSWYWQQPLWLSWWGPGLHRHKQKTMLLIQDLYMFDSMIQILPPRKTKHYRQRLELTWTTDVTSLRWSSHLVISCLKTMCLPVFPFFPRTIQASANALSCHLCPGHMPCQWWQTRYLKHHLIVQWHPRRQCLPWGKTWEVSFEVCKAENVPNPYRRLNATGR